MASINWSDLNDKFLKFDKLCENLCKEFNINLNNDQQISNENIKFDISTYKDDNLLSYTCLLPNKLRPLTYSNVTNQLLNQLINDECFKNDGTCLRTIEKGVFHPVLHYSTIHNQDNFIELFNVDKFGNNYTLYQSIYKELYCIELPLVNSKKFNQNNNKNEISIKNNNKLTINTNFNQSNNSITINQEMNQEMNQETNEDFKSFDYLSTDSGCVSLNSTNDSFDTNDNLKTNKTLQNSLESLNSSFNSNDSVLNSINSIKSNKQTKKVDYDCLNIKNKNNLNIDKNLFNNNYLNNLNDGHLIIGFRINDELFRKIFENNIFDISGARWITPIAAEFGLTKLRLLKRITLNTDYKNNNNDYLTTFNYYYLLHAEFLNLNYENEIYLSNFVHRLRLRSLGSVTLYTNLK